jgi:hypothetical protein
MTVRYLVLAAGAAFALGCGDHATTSTGAAPLTAISDGSSGGNAHFFFLPPLVANAGAGANDASVDPAVVICEWDGSVCTQTLATFTTDITTTTTTQPGNSETVRRGADHFIVNWHTRGFDLDAASTYRICVKVGSAELGFADVDVVNSGSELKGVGGGFIPLIDGRTLPIKFRIEEGALPSSVTCVGGTGPE